MGEPDIAGENVPLPDKELPFLSGPTSQMQTQKEAKFKWPTGGGKPILQSSLSDNQGGIHILVITDHFTRYAQAIVTSLQTAKCTAQNLWDKFIVHYGLPEKILTEQGHNFESNLLKALCEIAQVKKMRTLGYHPATNGQCKHFNATLISMLGTLPEKPKSTWREQVPTLVHAYNCTKNSATGFSPYYLKFGCKPHLPIDLIFVTNLADLKGNHITYIENLKKRMAWAYEIANDVVQKEQERNK